MHFPRRAHYVLTARPNYQCRTADLVNNYPADYAWGGTKIAKIALLFFAGQVGVRSCVVRDITNVGAGLHIHDFARAAAEL